MRIVFMGTPEFAVPCLNGIVSAGHDLCGVFTRKDKPKGRGYELCCSPVKDWAVHHEVAVFQPATLKNGNADEELRALKPDVIVVTAYGCILPPSVLSIPKYGCINVHASLLPKYRGAAPIQWAILNGERETGVTTMHMAEGLDTGDMILKARLDIGEDETAGELHDRLCALGADLLGETLILLEQGRAPREKQKEEDASWAPMLDRSLSDIHWEKPAGEIHNQVRGLNPWPCAVTLFSGKRLRVLQSRRTGEPAGRGTSGEIVQVDSDGIRVRCGDGGVLLLTQVQPEGRRRMSAWEFAHGHAVAAGAVLGR